MLGVLLDVLVGIVQRIPDIALVVQLPPHVGRASQEPWWLAWSGRPPIRCHYIVQALHCVPSHVLELREDQEGTLDGDTSFFVGIVGWTNPTFPGMTYRSSASSLVPMGQLWQVQSPGLVRSHQLALVVLHWPVLARWQQVHAAQQVQRQRPVRPVIHLRFLLRRSRQERWRSPGGTVGPQMPNWAPPPISI